MRVVAITQARLGSTRLPGKILKDVNGVSLLELHLRRILQSKGIDRVIVATTVAEEDMPIAEMARQMNLGCFRGSVEDVLDRFYQALQNEHADYVVRLTSDCPLIDPILIDKVIRFAVENQLDYASNVLDPSYPDGEDIEVFRYGALERAWREATLPSEREHVTPFIWKNSSFNGGSFFKSGNFNEGYAYGHLRLTVDEPDDLDVIRNVTASLGFECSWLEYVKYIEQHADVSSLNQTIGRNEGYEKSLNKEKK
jgi:spore coat polysaccharide biosynthesis protein SpsF